jgi:hypothetical protein
MNYENLVRDFAIRTRKNLDALRAIQQSQSAPEVYEVTQLINSMLGLLVFPQQRYVDRIPRVPLDELSEQGWPIPKVIGDYPQVANLHQLVRHLRNAIAHFNLEFMSDGLGKIDGLKVWNTDPRRNNIVTWKAELTIGDIEKITDKFVELLLDTAHPNESFGPTAR